MGVKKTCVVKFIRKGDTGAKGEQGAVLRGPQAWSDCATGYAFKQGAAGEAWLDVVMYNSFYYRCKKSHTKAANNYPGSTIAENQGLWELGDSIGLVATQILLAQYALVKNLGVETIDMKDGQGNILFQAKNGNVTCKTGTFENVNVKGTITADVFYHNVSQYLVSTGASLSLPTDVGQIVIIRLQGATGTAGAVTLPSPVTLKGQMLDIYCYMASNMAAYLYPPSGYSLVDISGASVSGCDIRYKHTQVYSDGTKWIRLLYTADR